MRVNVISDVHYQLWGLTAAADDCDLFFCFGDLVLFLDYDDPGQGIFADLFGPDNAAKYVALRTEKKFEEARAFGRQLWAGGDTEPRSAMAAKVAEQYGEIFARLPSGYYTYGNVDVPDMWPQFLGPGQEVLDGQTLVVDGITFGFVGGGLQTPMRTPFEISEEDYAAKVAALGPVDVLCSHIPPNIADICYDTEGRRLERGSDALLDYILKFQPRLALHGHVHNPLVRSVSLGSTQIVNVGHFRRNCRPFSFDVDAESVKINLRPE